MLVYSDPFALVKEVIPEIVKDYINYKKAQVVLWKYLHKYYLSVADPKTLDALLIISEHEKIQENKKIRKFVLKNSKKTA